MSHFSTIENNMEGNIKKPIGIIILSISIFLFPIIAVFTTEISLGMLTGHFSFELLKDIISEPWVFLLSLGAGFGIFKLNYVMRLIVFMYLANIVLVVPIVVITTNLLMDKALFTALIDRVGFLDFAISPIFIFLPLSIISGIMLWYFMKPSIRSLFIRQKTKSLSAKAEKLIIVTTLLIQIILVVYFVKFQFHDDDFVKDGTYKTYYDTGELHVEVNHEKYRREGLLKEYYRTGDLRSEIYYVNGKENGQAKLYYKNGNLKKHFNYSQGKLNGSYWLYNENGTLQKEGIYKDGVIIKL